jgi:hypothetical protein
MQRLDLKGRPALQGHVSHTMTHRQLEVQVYALTLKVDGSHALERPDDVALSRLDQKMLAVLQMAPLFT